MLILDVGSRVFSERIRSFHPLIQFLLTYSLDGFAAWRPRRQFYRRWRPWLTMFCISALIGLIIWITLRKEIGKTSTLPLSNKMLYQSRNIRVPHYLLLDVNDNNQPICKQIFDNIIPNIERHNMTEKDLIRSLFGNYFNPAYIAYSNTNETIPMMQGKFCSNISNEWILFTILEKKTLEKISDENEYPIESISGGSTKKHQCVSFDFNKCSLDELQNDYPKLFEFKHEQHVKGINENQSGMPMEIVYIVYHFIRRKAADYIQYKHRLVRSTSTPTNATISALLITSKEILIRIEIERKSVFFANMDCTVSAQGKSLNQIHSFSMNNQTILFDRLFPSTSYNICASCGGIDKVCKQVKTLSQISSMNLQTIKESSSQNIISLTSIVVIALTLCMLFLIAFVLFRPVFLSCCHRRSTNLNGHSTLENSNPSYDRTISNAFTDDESVLDDEETLYDTSSPPDIISVSTASGISAAEDLRSLSSSLNLACLNT